MMMSSDFGLSAGCFYGGLEKNKIDELPWKSFYYGPVILVIKFARYLLVEYGDAQYVVMFHYHIFVIEKPFLLFCTYYVRLHEPSICSLLGNIEDKGTISGCPCTVS